MFPNLLETTKDYWKKLDELEAAYKRGEVSIEEVDARVQSLMTELGQERRLALNSLWHSWNRLWNEQRETILGLAFWLFRTCYAEIKYRNYVSLTGQGFEIKKSVNF